MTDTGEIQLRIRSFILEKFPTAKKRGLDDDLQLLQTGIVDSLGILDIVKFLEESFHLSIDDDELMPENFGDVRSLVSFVARKHNQLEVPAK